MASVDCRGVCRAGGEGGRLDVSSRPGFDADGPSTGRPSDIVGVSFVIGVSVVAAAGMDGTLAASIGAVTADGGGEAGTFGAAARSTTGADVVAGAEVRAR